MSRFLKCLVRFIRSLLVGMLGEVLIIMMFIVAILSWAYFSSIYAAIPALVIGFALIIYVIGFEEKNLIKIQVTQN